MKRVFLAALIWACLGTAPVQCLAAQKFVIAGVEVTLTEDDWEVRDVKIGAGQIGARGVEGTIANDAKLLVRRSAAGQVLAALLITGSLGTSKGIRFLDTSCPKVSSDVFYARRLALHESDPPQCLILGGPFNGPKTFSNSLNALKATDVPDVQVPDSAWQVVAYAFNGFGARFSVDGVVATDGFNGLPASQPLAAWPARIPAEVAAWGDAMGAAMQKALDGFFSRKTTLPPITFTAAGAPR